MIEINTIESYSQLADTVNPNNDSLRVQYKGSGGDLLTPALTTNSDKFAYIDECSISEGYGVSFYERMKEEASELGIKNLTIENEGKFVKINYTYKHKQDKAPRPREINFYVENAFAFWPPEFENGYDVLITRGEAPDFIGYDVQMQQLGEKMAVGGFFISDREIAMYLLPHWIGFEEIPNKTDFPCAGPAKVYRKVKKENEKLLSNLFRFDDAIWDIISYIRGGSSYTLFRNASVLPGFINLEKMKERFESELDEKFSTVQKIFRKLPEKIKIEALTVLSPEFPQDHQPEAYEHFRELLLHL